LYHDEAEPAAFGHFVDDVWVPAENSDELVAEAKARRAAEKAEIAQFDPLPCPFCGHDNLTLVLDDDPLWVVFCEHCWGSGGARANQADAVKAWNRRTAG
jgi:Lar family restriction alleviation protein